MNGWYAQVIAKLGENGYRFYRTGKGAHELWTNDKRNQTVSRNMPSRHTANDIMKQAGINHRF